MKSPLIQTGSLVPELISNMAKLLHQYYYHYNAVHRWKETLEKVYRWRVHVWNANFQELSKQCSLAENKTMQLL